MKIQAIAFAGAAFFLAAGTAGQAQPSREMANVVEKDARGHATQVNIQGKTYEVCRKGVQDSCINARAAGLHWGDRPLGYWPGKPASEMKRR